MWGNFIVSNKKGIKEKENYSIVELTIVWWTGFTQTTTFIIMPVTSQCLWIIGNKGRAARHLCHILFSALHHSIRYPSGIFSLLISNWTSHKWSYYSQLHQQHLLFQRQLLKHTQWNIQIPWELSYFIHLHLLKLFFLLSWFTYIYIVLLQQGVQNYVSN